MTAAIFMGRIHRLERLYVDNPVYFLTFCTVDRKRILADEGIHDEEFEKLFIKGAEVTANSSPALAEGFF
ncbi:MAG TPA: hypothetical protein VH597_08365 [Verrucomicrobiae bacterium]|nr:hypothetical protein [Verrucomicrobiae bacterium]